jgi:hypothetical protein
LSSDNSLVKKLAQFADRNAELEAAAQAAKDEHAALLKEVVILREQGCVSEQ